jgi:outer membrane protein
MSFRYKLALVLGLCGLLCIVEGARRTVHAAGAAIPCKVGFVDLQDTLEKTKKGKAAKAKLEADKAKRQKDIDKKKKDLEASFKDLEKQKGVLKPEVLQAKGEQLQKDYLDLQQQFAASQQELLKAEAQLTREIFKQAAKIIESIAKRDGYSMIIEKNEGAILWADPSLAITDEVNKQLDASK